jgi:RNA polymerase sigma-70 factor (ECF subfamily)
MLMADFQRRLDADAMAGLVCLFARPALAVAWQILGHQGLAEDAVQEAFLRVVRGRDQYDPSQRFSVWFYAILRHMCIDLKRRHARHQAAIQEYAARRDSGSDGHDADDYGLLEMMRALPPLERDVLVLRIVEGLSFAEIAAAVGISEEAAKKRSQRGLQRLRARVRRLEDPAIGPAVLSPKGSSRRREVECRI